MAIFKPNIQRKMNAIFKITTFIFFTLINTAINAQSSAEEVIYLKNGSVIRGIIVEQVPNQSLKIQTKDKNIFVFNFEEIEKISKDLLPESNITEQNKNSYDKSIELFNQSNQRAFILLNCGYALSMGAQNISYYSFYNETVGSSSYSSEQVNVSLAKGLSLGGALGYMFNDHFGAELCISYLNGSKSTATAKDLLTNRTIDKSLSANMFRINPTIIISSGKSRFSPYAKFALVIGSGSVIYEIDNNKAGDVYNTKLKLNGGIAFGLNSGIGANFKIGPNTSLFSEIDMYNMSYSPKKGEYIEATHNGVDITSSQYEIKFVDSYNINSNSPTDSAPKKELKQKLPFGSVGASLGLKINF